MGGYNLCVSVQCFYDSETVIISVIPWGQAGIARIDRKTCSVSSSCLGTRSRKTTFNTNNFSILRWIPWTSHGMTLRVLFDPRGQCRHDTTKKSGFPPTQE